LDDHNKEPSSNKNPAPSPWKERFRWIAVLMVAACAGMGPAPPPKPPRESSEYSQIAEDPDGPELDPELHFAQPGLTSDQSNMVT